MRRLVSLIVVGLPVWGQINPSDRAPEVLGVSGGGWLDRLKGPYIAKRVPAIDFRNSGRIYNLIRAGNMYLSLEDAIALAIENNLDVEISRFDMLEARTDVLRAEGGGTLRGVTTTVTQIASGVGGPTSPLLTGAATGVTPSTAVPTNVTELSALSSSGASISVLTESYSAGPPIPPFDPALVGNLMLEHQTTPEPSSFSTGYNTLTTNMTTGSLSLQQGFSPGTQYTLGYNATSQNINSVRTNYNPSTTSGWHSPSHSRCCVDSALP